MVGDGERAGRYRKWVRGAPSGYVAWEAAGLRWLAEAREGGGARVVEVYAVGAVHLDLERLNPCQPTAAAAEDLGRALAHTHAAGASGFGAPPSGWHHASGWLGPADEPLPLPTLARNRWGEFYAEQRIEHTLALGQERGSWRSAVDAQPFRAIADRLRHGDFDDGSPPARIHGDLWSGNLVWTDTPGNLPADTAGSRPDAAVSRADTAGTARLTAPVRAVLIDPAAHGGHPETDLAMLALFGAPHLGRILAAYQEVSPLSDGWRERVHLHQLHPVMLHAVLFGGGYVSRARALAEAYL
ncbi:MAG: fructosamine kinase family protein [Tetrasphaera sp.]|nr:fructosamine kinase family protein [Tetrasphaera sp.]